MAGSGSSGSDAARMASAVDPRVGGVDVIGVLAAHSLRSYLVRTSACRFLVEERGGSLGARGGVGPVSVSRSCMRSLSKRGVGGGWVGGWGGGAVWGVG